MAISSTEIASHSTTDAEFVHNLPKLELHVHIEGTLTAALRWKLAQRNHVTFKYATLKELEDSYKVM